MWRGLLLPPLLEIYLPSGPPCLADLSTPHYDLASLATFHLEGLLSAVRNLEESSELLQR